jgi:hypothetical protein
MENRLRLGFVLLQAPELNLIEGTKWPGAECPRLGGWSGWEAVNNFLVSASENY